MRACVYCEHVGVCYRECVRVHSLQFVHFVV